MNKKTLGLFFIFTLIVITAGLFLNFTKTNDQKTNEVLTTHDKKAVKIGDKQIKVEVADTPEKMKLGLGGRDKLAENEGMLFVYENKSPAVFWMKGMNFDLDIIWIADGKVIQIDNQVPAEPGADENSLKRYVSQQPVDYVIEVNAGFTQKNNIKVGDPFQILSYP